MRAFIKVTSALAVTTDPPVKELAEVSSSSSADHVDDDEWDNLLQAEWTALVGAKGRRFGADDGLGGFGYWTGGPAE